jgi:dolichyl-phosphate beta-glucosyltransferase
MYFRTASSARLADTFSGGSENGLYLGVPLLILLLLGALFWCRRRVPVRVVAVVTVLAFVLSLGSRLVVGHHVYTSVPLPETFFNRVPLLNSTIAARYAQYVMLGAAAMLAMILEAVRERLKAGVFAAVGPAGLAAVALVPLLPAWPYWLNLTQVPPYFTSALRSAEAHIPEGSVAVTYPFPLPRDADPMLWQVAAGMRYKSPGGRFVAPLPPAAGETVAGVFSFLSAGRPVAQTPALRAALTGQLHAWHVRTVLVQAAGGQRPAQVLPFFDWLLGRPPDTTTGGISAWYGQM